MTEGVLTEEVLNLLQQKIVVDRWDSRLCLGFSDLIALTS